jgi:gliding motility-associated-like protein
MQRLRLIDGLGNVYYQDNALQLAALDSTGIGLWMKQFMGPTGGPLSPQDFAIDTTQLRIYAVARGGPGLLVVAFDTSGNVVWAQELAGNRFNVVRLAVLDGGNLAVAFQDGTPTRPHVAVFSPQGQCIYIHRYEVPITFFPSLALGRRQGGGAYLAVSVYDWVNADDVIVLALAPQGQVDWAYRYGSGSSERVSALAETPTGHVVLTGTTDAETSTEWLGINRDIWLLTLRSDGLTHLSVSYRRVLRTPAGAILTHYPEAARDIAVDADSAAVIVGLVDYYEGYIDSYILKVRPYYADVMRVTRGGGLTTDQSYAVSLMPDSGWLVMGEMRTVSFAQYIFRTGPNLEIEPCFANPAPDKFEITVLDSVLRYPLAASAQPVPNNWAPSGLQLLPDPDFQTVKQDVDLVATVVPETCPESNDAQVRITGLGLAPFSHFLGPVNANSLYPRQTDSVFYNVPPGTYLVAVGNANGCTARDTVTVVDLPPFAFTLADTTQVVCHGDSLALMATAQGATPPYVFNLSDGQALLAPDTARFAPLAAGAHTFTLQDQNGCTRVVDFFVQAHPEIQMGLPDTFTLPTGPHDPQAFALGAALPPGGTWAGQWVADPQAGRWQVPSAADTGWYSVTYTWNGCTGTRPVLMREPKGMPLLPTAFSPNGDGINDVLTLHLPRHTAFALEIWDRWGRPVFQTEHWQMAWDGTHNGAPLPEGVYPYRCSLTLPTGETLRKAGTITLVR